jgi:RNA polymerase sigma factor (sigma-70 family)
MAKYDIEKLYKEYFKSVYLFTLKLTDDSYLAEDITSETFLKAMTKVDEFEGRCDIRVWLCQIAKNIFLNRIRDKKYVNVPIDEIELADDIDIDKEVIDRCDAVRLYKRLHILKEPYKEVFFLRIFCDMDFKQIAVIFEKTPDWACVTYYRARKMLSEDEDI